jgi:hypothetical protein
LRKVLVVGLHIRHSAFSESSQDRVGLEGFLLLLVIVVLRVCGARLLLLFSWEEEVD